MFIGRKRSVVIPVAITMLVGCLYLETVPLSGVGQSCVANVEPVEEKKTEAKNEEPKSDEKAVVPDAKGSGSGRKENWHKQLQGSPSLADCKKLVKEKPDSANAHNDYGWALRQHGDLKDAEKELRKALELDDTIPWGHSNLSVVLLDKGETAEAVKEAKRAVGIDEKHPVFHVVLGNALSASGEHDEAIKQYNAAINLKPDYENALYNLGRVLNIKGDNAQASQVLSQALKLDPSDDRVLSLLDKLLK